MGCDIKRLMSNTSHNITEQVEQCAYCYGYFVIGLEGEGNICDKCNDAMPDPNSHDLNGELAEGQVAL